MLQSYNRTQQSTSNVQVSKSRTLGLLPTSIKSNEHAQKALHMFILCNCYTSDAELHVFLYLFVLLFTVFYFNVFSESYWTAIKSWGQLQKQQLCTKHCPKNQFHQLANFLDSD